MIDENAVAGGKDPFKRNRAARAGFALLSQLAAVFFFFLLSGPALPQEGNSQSRLNGVDRWLLLLNSDLDHETVGRIAASPYDMAVVDDIATLRWNEGMDVRPLVAEMKRGSNGAARLVVSYLNVGQAEDYRLYFDPAWMTAPPGWLIGADPEGWAGNFPVAYWHPEWQRILVGPDGLVRQIAREGFDGAYLDWVAGYNDDAVLARAERDGVDARAEMIRLLLRVAEAARAVNPAFQLILQNVPDLAIAPDIVAIAGGFVQEAIWFDGTVDDNPPGDCPLPRRASDVRSAAYLASLPAPCALAYREGRAPILDYAQEQHVVPLLSRARQLGLAVFAVEYAVQPANVAEAVRRAHELGFKPFVGARSLAEYRPPPF